MDNVFANPDWCCPYPKAKVTYLPRCHSDHCLVLLELLPSIKYETYHTFFFFFKVSGSLISPFKVSGSTLSTSLKMPHLSGIDAIFETSLLRREGL